MCGLGKMSDGAKFKRLKKDPDYQKILKELTYRKGLWEGNKKTPYAKIARGNLTKKAKVKFYFLSSVLTPTKHVYTMRVDKAILLYAILKGYKISFGKIIEKSILEYQSNNLFGHMLHPSIITHLCIKGGVTFDKDEEEKCHVVSPLTLTTITKTPVSKGKEKLEGVKEEIGDKEDEMNNSELNDQALVISKQHIRNVRERSASPGWVMYPEVVAYQKDRDESSS